jgi:putative membrane protein
MTGTAVGDGWRRLDPRMLLIGPIHDLIRFAVPLLLLLVSRQNSGGAHWPTLVAAGVVVALGMSRWFTTRYRIGTTQVEMRTGLLRRRSITVPVDRIRTVDVNARALHRLLGVASVSMGTGRHDRAKKDELHLAAVSVHEAQRLRAELLHRRGTGPDGAALAGPLPADPTHPSAPEVVTIVRLDPRWIRYAPFTTSGVFTLAAVAGVLSQYVNEYHVNPARLGPIRAVSDAIGRIPVVAVIGSGLLALVLLVAALSTAGYLLAFWGFTLERHPDGVLHVQRGLLTRRSVSIEERRLRGVEVSEPLLLRAVNGARTIAVMTGLRVGRGSERGGELLLPPGPREQAHRVASAVLGEADPTLLPLSEHGRNAQTRRYTRAIGSVIVLAAVVAGIQFALHRGGWDWLAPLVLIPFAALLAFDRYRNLGHTLSASYLVTRVGSLARRTTALQRTGIIGWRIHTSLFQRRVGLVTLTATTAGGRGRYEIPDVATDEAIRVATSATPGLLEPFLV